ncbi:hypothetical protein ACFLST_01155 [Chloroflexota bacterium]
MAMASMTLVHGDKIDLAALVSRLAAEPAKIIGKGEIGTLKTGAFGDVTVFDPNAEWVVDPSGFASKGKNTPVAGRSFKGKVMATVCRGDVVHKDDSVKLEMIRLKAGAGLD